MFRFPDATPFVAKFCFALFFWVVAFQIARDGTSQPVLGIAIAAMSALAGVFMATLAVIRPVERGVEYRRLRGWHLIPYDEVEYCGKLFGDTFDVSLGKLKLRKPIPPWGTLFFVFYLPDALVVGRRKAASEIVNHIRKRLTRADGR
jgi:hypothetical protein